MKDVDGEKLKRESQKGATGGGGKRCSHILRRFLTPHVTIPALGGFAFRPSIKLSMDRDLFPFRRFGTNHRTIVAGSLWGVVRSGDATSFV